MKRKIVAILVTLLIFAAGFLVGYRATIRNAIVSIENPHWVTIDVWGRQDGYYVD